MSLYVSDEEIRKLERAVNEDPTDLHSEVKLLAARRRAGLISSARLNLAARLGYEAAKQAGGKGMALKWLYNAVDSNLYSYPKVAACLRQLPKITLLKLSYKWCKPVIPALRSMLTKESENLTSCVVAMRSVRSWIKNNSPKNHLKIWESIQSTIMAYDSLHLDQKYLDGMSFERASNAIMAINALTLVAYGHESFHGHASIHASKSAFCSVLTHRMLDRRKKELEKQRMDVIHALLEPREA